MPASQADAAKANVSNNSTTAGRPVEPHVRNANRVVVGFPFSSIKIEDHAGAAEVAGVVARLCRLLAGSAPVDAFAELAADAQDLQERLGR